MFLTVVNVYMKYDRDWRIMAHDGRHVQLIFIHDQDHLTWFGNKLSSSSSSSMPSLAR
jgi:hypothetical protein